MTVVIFAPDSTLGSIEQNIEAPPHGLRIQTWVVGKEPRPDTCLMFVSAEHAGYDKAFRQFLYLMHHQIDSGDCVLAKRIAFIRKVSGPSPTSHGYHRLRCQRLRI
jgi:hypothetical protein